MKYILYLLFLGVFIACDHHEEKLLCTYIGILDNYPKEVKKQNYSRELLCILMFKNVCRDSVFFPFYGIEHGNFKSAFYIKYKANMSRCPARFWGIQNNTHVVAVGDSVRIGIGICSKQLQELHIKNDIDIQELDKIISFHYKYNPQDAAFSHKKVFHKVLIIRRKDIKFIYNSHNLFDIWEI